MGLPDRTETGLPDRLDTERLSLRPMASADAAVHRRLWAERDPRVPAHRRIDQHGRPTVADLAAGLDPAVQGPFRGLRSIVRRADDAVVGYCGLLDDGPRGTREAPEIAYELVRSAHGQGFATEAARAVIEWADASGIPRIVAGVRDWNAPSLRVLAKLGFTESGEVERDDVHGDSILLVRDHPGAAPNPDVGS